MKAGWGGACGRSRARPGPQLLTPAGPVGPPRRVVSGFAGHRILWIECLQEIDQCFLSMLFALLVLCSTFAVRGC